MMKSKSDLSRTVFNSLGMEWTEKYKDLNIKAIEEIIWQITAPWGGFTLLSHQLPTLHDSLILQTTEAISNHIMSKRHYVAQDDILEPAAGTIVALAYWRTTVIE